MLGSLNEYSQSVHNYLLSVDQKTIEEIVDTLVHCKGTIYFIGNGASASMASHFSADMMKNGRVKTACFHDPAFLTCYSNDFGYENVFSRALEDIATKNDILLAISSSGNSENIINAVEVAKHKGMKVIGFSGFTRNNRLKQMSDISVYLEAYTYGEVEISHNVALHYIVDRLEAMAQQAKLKTA
ncbi:MAG: phosphoheptose isomerase [Melioribacteraceae bacterium]|nr:MAG: phosphoheptose isomerase [Melioribacteraceae bacterium]